MTKYLILASILISSMIFGIYESYGYDNFESEENSSKNITKNTVIVFSDSTDEDCRLACTDPSELFIDVGSTVEWINTSNSPRSFSTGYYYEGEKAREFSVDNRFNGHVSSNGKFSFLFSEPGEYQYFINEHRLLKVLGTIHVLDNSYTEKDTSINTLREIMEDKNSTIPITSLNVNPKNSIIKIEIDDQTDLKLPIHVYKQMLYQKIGKKYFELVTHSVEDDTMVKNNWKFFQWEGKQFLYSIPYQIINGTIKNISIVNGYNSILFAINSSSNSSLIIETPYFSEIVNGLQNSLGFNFLIDKTEQIPPQAILENSVIFSKDFKAGKHEIEITAVGFNQNMPSSYDVREFLDYPSKFSIPHSPKIQQDKGVLLSEIICKDKFEFILKQDSSPSCVKPESVSKLIDRGWAKQAN